MTWSRRRTLAAVGAALVLGSATLAGCGSGDAEPAQPSPTASAGAVVVPVAPIATSDAVASTVSVQLPTGTLTVFATDSLTTVPAGAAADGRSHAAGAGRSYLGVDWSFVVGAGVPAWAGPLVDGEPVAIPLALESGGQSYDLGVAARDADTSPSAPTSGGYVLVGQKVSAAQLKVTFDGVTQMVDLRTGAWTQGPDPGLDGLSQDTPQSVDCSSTVLPAGVDAPRAGVGVACGWWHRSLPWVSELGWADASDPASAGWVVAEVGTQGSTWTRTRDTWQVDAITDTTSGASRTLPVLEQPTSLASIYVLPPGTTSVPVARTVTGTLESGSGADRGVLELAGDLPLS